MDQTGSKFLQLLHEASEKLYHSDKVSGVPTDTEHLIATMLTPCPEEDDFFWSRDQESPDPDDDETGDDDNDMSSEVVKSSLVSALITRLFKKAPRKTIVSYMMEDIATIINRLSEKVWKELNIPTSSLSRVRQSRDKIIKAVTKDLEKDYGSIRKVLEAAASPNYEYFDNAVIMKLDIHVTAFLNPPRKSAVAKFFSAVGKSLRNMWRF